MIKQVKEVFQRQIPTDEKDYPKCSFIVLYFAQPQHTKGMGTNIYHS